MTTPIEVPPGTGMETTPGRPGRFARALRNRWSVGMLAVRGLRVWLLARLRVLQARGIVLVGTGVELRIYGELVLGDRVFLDRNCSIQVGPRGRLVLGSDTYVGQGTVISAAHEIVVGERVLIAEHCSVRDGDHQLDPDARRAETEMTTAPILIEHDCWIAAGARILKGSRLGSGAIVAANAVVRGEVHQRSVVAGVPARVVKRL